MANQRATKSEDIAIKLENYLKESLAISRKVHHEECSIYKVPDYIKNVNSKDYEPKLVSFGPYHHGHSQLLPMEEHKLNAFRRFQNACSLTRREIADLVSGDLQDFLKSYDDLEVTWKQDPAKFLHLLLFDGCFMLDVLDHAIARGRTDPIFSTHGHVHVFPDIKRDMLLLENQLPLKLLQKLYSIKPKPKPKDKEHTTDDDVKQLVCRFFCHPGKKFDNISGFRLLHVLDVYRQTLILSPLSNPNNDIVLEEGVDYESQVTRSATELRDGGIKFEKSETDNLMDFSYKGGVVKIPQIVVDDGTKSTFLNIMAFEKLHVESGSEITSYIYFMDNLIDVDKDVALLTSRKIIVNALGSDMAAADLFNSMAEGATMESDTHLSKVLRKVNEHCSSSWNEWIAQLNHNYFNNPWAIISFIAAILGFALVIFQVAFDAFGYYHPREK